MAGAVAEAEELTLAGLAGYEGVFTPKDPEGPAKVDRYLDSVAEIARALDAQGLFGGERVILSAGGSKFFDIVAKKFTAVRLSPSSRLTEATSAPRTTAPFWSVTCPSMYAVDWARA